MNRMLAVRRFSVSHFLQSAPKQTIIQLNQMKVRKHGIRDPESKRCFEWHSLILLPLPFISCYLGVWQLQRMKWKRELIESLKVEGRHDVKLRDEHLSYAMFWFTLSATTAVMWVTRYLR